MYYTGLDPRDMKPVYVCKNPHEKAMQRALIQYRNPKNYDLVYEALVTAGREDLIGFDKKCLIKPRRMASSANIKNSTGKQPSQKQSRTTGRKTSDKPPKKKAIRNVHKKKEK